MMFTRYSKADDAYLKSKYKTMTCAEIGRVLKRTEGSIKGRVSHLGLQKRDKHNGDVSHELYQGYLVRIRRCHKEGYRHYPFYGGNGAIVCQEWRDDFRVYVRDMVQKGWYPGCNKDLHRINHSKVYSNATTELLTKEEHWLVHSKERRKLSKQEVIQSYIYYYTCLMGVSQIHRLFFKNKISRDGIYNVIHGRTYKDIFVAYFSD